MICTTACGAGLDLVQPGVNGLLTEPGDATGLARAMRWMHDHEAELAAMGRHGQAQASTFSAAAWAERWHNYVIDVVGQPHHP